MIIDEIKNISVITDKHEPVKVGLNYKSEIHIYPKSINEYNESLFFIGMEEAEKYATLIARNGPLAIKAIKQSVQAAIGLPLKEGLAKELEYGIRKAIDDLSTLLGE